MNIKYFIMLQSMTGFGRGVIKSRLGTITTEIKTVNHRYLDLVVRLPKELQGLDPKIKNFIKKSIHRGRVEVFIERRSAKTHVSAEINYTLVRSYLTNLQKLEKEFKLKDTASLSQLCQIPGVIELRTHLISIDRAWGETRKSINKALQALLIMRQREGKFTEKDIKNRLKILKKKQKEIKKRLPILLSNYRKALKTKLAEPSTELAMFSEKIDITEEISRFSSHLAQIGLFLNEKGDVGKKINFTIQEMMREVNTMAAKANDFTISRAVVLMKAELEKIKEQIQNIE